MESERFGYGIPWARSLMPSFDFRPQFAPMILSGAKVQTIRAKARCKVGDMMYLFTGMRSPDCRRLAQRPCVVVDSVRLTPDGIIYGNAASHPTDVDHFAQLDGFVDYAEMLEWFRRQYRVEHFDGFVHRWLKEPAQRDGITEILT